MRFARKILPLATGLAMAAMLGACATNEPIGTSYPSDNGTSSYPSASQGAYAEYGRVADIQYLRTDSSGGVVGTVAGGAVGGLLGHQVGGGSGRTAATIVGAVAGALIGNALERQATGGGQPFYRVTVQFDNGAMRSFDYADAPNVQVGDRVYAQGEQLYR